MPKLRYLVSMLAIALLMLWAVGTPRGPVGAALSQARGPVDPRVAERAQFMIDAERRITYALHRQFANFGPLVELQQTDREFQVLIPRFMFEGADTSKPVMEALMLAFIDAPGMRLRVHAPSDMGEEERLRVWRLTDKAVSLAAIPPSSLDFSRAPAAPGGWVTFIFTSGMGRFH